MAMSGYIKAKINEIINKSSIDNLDFSSFYMGKRNLYTYDELVDYLIELSINKMETNGSIKKIAVIIKAINLTIDEYVCLYKTIDSVAHKKLVTFKNKVNEYISLSDKQDDVINFELNYLNDLLSHVESNENLNDEKIIDNLKQRYEEKKLQLNELKIKNDNLKKELRKVKKEYREYKCDCLQDDKVSDTILSLHQDLKRMNLENENYKVEIDSLNNELKMKEKENFNLNSLNQNQLKKLENERLKLKQVKDELKKIQQKANILDQEYSKKKLADIIDESILVLLLERASTINNLKGELEYTVGNVGVDTIYSSLLRLKSKYSIIEKFDDNLDIIYELSSPSYDTNLTINFDVSSFLDVIVISDLHMWNFQNEEINRVNLIYDYAEKNNIKIIINLGDLFDFRSFTDKDKYDNFKINNEVINKAIQYFPKSNIKHLLLGGNHDKLILGVDGIDILTKERQDFINLGYDHAKIGLGNDNIYLHHIASKFNTSIANDNYSKNFLLSALKKYHQKMGLYDSYLDLLGHVHKSSISITDGYAIVPSLNVDRFCNGAWRLKIYFDQNKNINNIVFIPLIVNTHVNSNTEIIYKKIKKGL